MNRTFIFCLLALSVFALQGCGGSSNQLPDEQSSGETKGQRFSRCLDQYSPEECDRMINGSQRRRSGY